VLRERERCLALSLFHRISFLRSSRRGGKNRKTAFSCVNGDIIITIIIILMMNVLLSRKSFLRCSQVNNTP
jgi:hypothetical protein